MASNFISQKQNPQLKCCICKEVFEQSINLLPCGENMCQDCLNKETKTNKTSFKCQTCGNNHKVPKKGFPKQNQFQSTLESDEPRLGLNELLERFETNILDSSTCIDEAEQRMKAQCDYVKDELEVSVESVIDELNKLKLSLFQEIDAYQEKCCKNIEDSRVEERKRFNETLLKCQKQLNEWKRMEFTSKSEILLISKEAHNLTSELKNSRSEFEKYFYGDKVISFKERAKELDTSILGKIFYKSYIDSGESYLVDIERLKSLKDCKKISYLTGDSVKTLGVHLSILASLTENKIVVCTYEVRNVAFTVCLRLYDINGTLLRNNYENVNMHLISMCAFEKHVSVILRDNLAAHSLKLYDATNLKLIKQIKLGFLPIASAIDGENSHIYIISLHDPFILMFNMNLEPITPRIRKGDDAHYLPMLCTMYIRQKRLFIKSDHDSKIRVISLASGLLEKCFNFLDSANCFIDIDMSLKIFVFNVNQNKLKVFDWQEQDGEANEENSVTLVYEKNLIGNEIRNGRSLCITETGTLVINDQNCRNFYFY